MIPQILVEKYYDDICFLVDINFTYEQIILPIITFLMPFPYEVTIDEVTTTITSLLLEEVCVRMSSHSTGMSKKG